MKALTADQQKTAVDLLHEVGEDWTCDAVKKKQPRCNNCTICRIEKFMNEINVWNTLE